jgi:hypothetical protein
MTHRKLFFNGSYGRLGLLGYPYWFFFEWLSPLLAFSGFVYTIYLIIKHSMNWPFYFLLFLFVYTFAVSLSVWAILFEEITFHKYKKKRDILKLVFTALLEPFFYPMHTIFAVRGNIEAMARKKGWGTQDRKGFDKKKKKHVHKTTVPQSAKSGMDGNSVLTT